MNLSKTYNKYGWLEWVALVGLLIAVTFLYSPGLKGPFLFDDAPNIIDNAVLTAQKSRLLDWWSAAYSSEAGSLRRPLAMLTFASQISEGKPESATALKAGNIFIHCICGCLLYLLVRNLVRAMGTAYWGVDYRWLPLLSAALWTLNPLLLSTVLYPVQRMAQLSALFVLLGLMIYSIYRARWSLREFRADEFAACALWLLLCTSLAMLSKENGVLLPWLVLVLEVTLCMGCWAGGYSVWVKWTGIAAFSCSILFMAWLLFWNWDWISNGYDYRDFTMRERLWTQARVLWTYAGWFAVPRLGELGLFHDDIVISRSWFSPVTTFIAAAAWVLVLTVALAVRQRFPWLLMAALFYLIGHSMESGFLALELVFEHRNYLPSIALAIFLGAVLLRVMKAGRENGNLFLTSLVLPFFVLIFAGSLLLRAQTWSSEAQLASDSYARHPTSPRSAHFYANSLIRTFQNAANSGAQANEALIIARNEFELLNKRFPADLSALVMLYTLDSTYFSEVQNPERWLSGIEQSVANTKLKATEYAAMRVLLACANDGYCKIEVPRLNKIVTEFSQRYAYNDASAEMKLELLAISEATTDARIDLLIAALEETPNRPSLYYALIAEYVQLRDFASAHEVIIEVLKIDSSRHQLSIIEAMFAGDKRPSNAS